jgi:hypothetical protein
MMRSVALSRKVTDTLVTTDLTTELTANPIDPTVGTTSATAHGSSSIFNVTFDVPQQFPGAAKATTRLANFATQITANTMFGIGTAAMMQARRPGC